MKKKISYLLVITLITIPLLAQISGKAAAKTTTVAKDKLANEPISTKEFTQNEGFGNVNDEFEMANQEFGDLNDYLKDYNKVAKLAESGSKSYEKGLNEIEDSDEKEAKRHFKKASNKFNKADDKLSDLEPPGSATQINDLSTQALDKYRKGLKLTLKAVKADDSEKLTKATAIMREGLGLEGQLVIEGGKPIVYEGLQAAVTELERSESNSFKDIKFPDISDPKVQVSKTGDSKWTVKGFFDAVSDKPVKVTYDAQYDAKADPDADELTWSLNETEWR